MFLGIISNSIVLYQNYKYDNLYKDLENKKIKITGIVINQNKDKYKVKIENGKYSPCERILFSNTILTPASA